MVTISLISVICDKLGAQSCGSQFTDKLHKLHKLRNYQLTRYAYLNVGGRNIWVDSKLEYREGQFLWNFKPNFIQMDLAFGPRGIYAVVNPETLKNHEKAESTKVKARGLLEFVYSVYSNVTKSRDVFDSRFIAELRQEDALRDEKAVAIWGLSNDKGMAVWALYDHSKGSGPSRLEIGRLAKRGLNNISVLEIMPFISEHLIAKGLTEGKILIKTDNVGARYYQKLGAKIIKEYEPRKFELEISIQKFLNLFPKPNIENGGRPLLVKTFMDEPFFY